MTQLARVGLLLLVMVASALAQVRDTEPAAATAPAATATATAPAAAVAPEAGVARAPLVERLGEEAARAQAQLYDYDNGLPLEARVVEKVDRDGAPREKIVFRGAQGFLVPAYLQLPASGAGPHPCVLLLHGWSGGKENWWQDGNYISGGNARRALLAAGYAVLALDAQCHGDRIAENDFAPVNHYVEPAAGEQPRKGYFTLPDIYVQTVRDYRRAIDFLASRSEIDKQRIGVLGYSMGGTQTFVLTGVEPRVKVAVAVAAPAEKSKWAVVAPQNFVRAIGVRPFRTIIGTSDELCPREHAKELQTLFEAGAAQDQILFDAGHKLPADYVPRAVEWFEKHL
ncbi:MAG: alpha/beta hydrolase [Pirellulales bacterium]